MLSLYFGIVLIQACMYCILEYYLIVLIYRPFYALFEGNINAFIMTRKKDYISYKCVAISDKIKH